MEGELGGEWDVLRHPSHSSDPHFPSFLAAQQRFFGFPNKNLVDTFIHFLLCICDDAPFPPPSPFPPPRPPIFF